MLNALPVESHARPPRGAVTLDGEIITGWESMEVDNNAYRSADTFRVVFVASKLPPTRGLDWFAAQRQLLVECFISNDQGNYDADYRPLPADRLILGQADDVSIDLVAGTVEISGRDLTARLIDTKTTEHFKENTSADIANILAFRNNLEAKVVATKDKIGKYYAYDRVTLAQEQSDWQILTTLASIEDYTVYVKGWELHFEPRKPAGTDYFVIDWTRANQDNASPTSNAVSLQFSRSLTIAKGATVEVRSFNAKNGKPVIATFPKSSKDVRIGQSTAKTQVYKRFFAGLTFVQAQSWAEKIYRQIVAHEMRLTAYLPGVGLDVLDCTKAIQVRGTETAFNQIYYPESVIRTLSMNEGYRMNIRAKNSSPELEAALA
jgi:phage protein D